MKKTKTDGWLLSVSASNCQFVNLWVSKYCLSNYVNKWGLRPQKNKDGLRLQMATLPASIYLLLNIEKAQVLTILRFEGRGLVCCIYAGITYDNYYFDNQITFIIKIKLLSKITRYEV